MNTLLDRSLQRVATWSYKVEAGDLDTNGYATISSTTLGFIGATVPAIANATYDLDITVDGTLRQVSVALLTTDDWDGVATKLQTALRVLTSSTETVVVTGGKIKVTSATEGSTSTIVIAAGTAGSGGGDLLAYIDGSIASMTTSLDTPVNGIEGNIAIQIDENASASTPSGDLVYLLNVKSSTGIKKTGLISYYTPTTGYLTIKDNLAINELAANDVVSIVGHFY